MILTIYRRWTGGCRDAGSKTPAHQHAHASLNRKRNIMKFLVLGATGRTGVPFVKKALDQGHQVTALVRRADATVDPRAQIVSGDVTDAAVIATAARGHDAVISTLGVKNVRATPTLITDTVRAVIASAKTSGVDRFVIVSAFGVGDSLAKASLLAGLIFRTALRKKYADKAASEVLLRASDLKWTLQYPGAFKRPGRQPLHRGRARGRHEIADPSLSLSRKRRRLSPPLRRGRHLHSSDRRCHRHQIGRRCRPKNTLDEAGKWRV